MESRFEVDTYDYDKLQKPLPELDEFEDDLTYLMNDNHSTKDEQSKSLGIAEDANTKKVKTIINSLHRKKIRPKKNGNNHTKSDINEILGDLDDMGLSSDEDENEIIKNLQDRKASDQQETVVNAPVLNNRRLKKLGDLEVETRKFKNQLRLQHFERKLKVKPPEPTLLPALNLAPSTIELEPLSYEQFKFKFNMEDEDDDIENKLKLSRFQKQLYRVLLSDFHVKCQSKDEVLSKAKELKVYDIVKKREKGGNKKNNKKSRSPTPAMDSAAASATAAPEIGKAAVSKKTESSSNLRIGKPLFSLITNNPTYYNEHTTRTYDIDDLKHLPFTDDVMKTVILKASPKLKKLMEILITYAKVFDKNLNSAKDITTFWEVAVTVALEMPNYLSIRMQSSPIIPKLVDHESKEYKVLNKFGEEIIRGDDYLNIDLLALLGHILIWWNFHSRTDKRKFFLAHHLRQFSNNVMFKKIGGFHLWDLYSSQNKAIDDALWKVLEEMRAKYRYEEDQFYVVLRLMNCSMS